MILSFRGPLKISTAHIKSMNFCKKTECLIKIDLKIQRQKTFFYPLILLC